MKAVNAECGDNNVQLFTTERRADSGCGDNQRATTDLYRLVNGVNSLPQISTATCYSGSTAMWYSCNLLHDVIMIGSHATTEIQDKQSVSVLAVSGQHAENTGAAFSLDDGKYYYGRRFAAKIGIEGEEPEDGQSITPITPASSHYQKVFKER